MAFVFSAIYSPPFSPLLLICCSYPEGDLFLSFSLSTRPACLNFETRPCRERKRRYSPVFLVSLPSTPTMFCPCVRRFFTLLACSRPLDRSLGPHLAHSVSRRKRCTTTCAFLFLHSLLLAETNCSRVLQPFRGEGRTRTCTMYVH